jgi:SGNH hydrolase-like domain, acetyltransferase AlgX
MSATETPETPPSAAPGATQAAPGARVDELNLATDAHIDLERAVLPTEVSGRVAWLLIIAFCLPLAIVSAVQIALEATGRHRAQLGNLFKERPTRESLHRYEQDVAKNSVFKEYVQPRLQLAVSQTTGAGNGKVYVGRDGVLFFRPGMDFVTGRGIFDAGRMRACRKRLVDAGEHSAEPDPRPAILDFDAACRKAGVHLVVVPVPDKVTVLPEAAGYSESGAPALVNVDYPQFLSQLREGGVDVYDPLPIIQASGEQNLYLKNDTHWTPECMENVASSLAAHVREAVAFPGERARFGVNEMAMERVGDLVDMLSLPADQTLFPPQQVRIRQTIDAATEAPFAAKESADVLLLGDSFANIYTAPQMGWGEAAGFGPTLARHLNRDLDTIVINGKGASGTRSELARRPGGLTGKRVVIWEFAVRELTDASWDVIPMNERQPAESPTTRPSAASGGGLVIDATIEKISKVPEPFSVPYPDCLTYVLMHVDRVVEGKYADDRILAVLWAMKKNVWLPPAKYAPGRHMRIKVIPMGQADESVKTGQRADDTQDYSHRPYFVTEEQSP